VERKAPNILEWIKRRLRGRPPNEPVSPVAPQAPVDPTPPTGTPGGRPTGRPKTIRSREDEEVRRSLQRENDTANVLADQGYRVHQSPTRQEVADARARTGDIGDPRRDPDYLIEGKVFDCYSPSETKNVRGIWSEVRDKVSEKRQTQRVVINLQDWGGSLNELQKQFDDWPIEGLKEVKAITRDGKVIQVR
jgi:hypothetical protein